MTNALKIISVLLTYPSADLQAAIPEIEELNIGHAIVGRAVFVGLAAAVREIRSEMDRARGGGR